MATDERGAEEPRRDALLPHLPVPSLFTSSTVHNTRPALNNNTTQRSWLANDAGGAEPGLTEPLILLC